MSKKSPANDSSRTTLSDQRSRDRIVSELDRNLLVEAGAGSGKTHEMARRMAAGIASGEYLVDGMAAVTFTRKAAAELRGRFQLALEDELRGKGTAPLDAHRERRIRAALSNLERFFAGTIHSFCAHVLRERPVEAGVSPGFSELDEIEDDLLRRQSWRDYVSQQIAAGYEPMLELRDAGVNPRDLDEGFSVVTLYEEVEFPTGDAQKPDADKAWAALEVFWQDLQKLLPSPVAEDTRCATQKAARRFTGQLRVSRGRRGRHAAVAALLQTWNFEPGITQKWWASDAATKRRIRDQVQALHERFRNTIVAPFLTAWREYLYRVAITVLVDARDFAARARRRLNVMNYGDLLQLAVRVLRENDGVRREMQQKYRWLFVDEFQDTDPVQAEIIFLLASDGSSAVDWRTLPLRPGALFVVGDPKQSIYRFRRADIDIYNAVRQRLDNPPASETLPLTTNFRALPALSNWANDVFRQQFPERANTHSPQFAPLDPAPERQTAGKSRGGGVFTLTVGGDCEQREVCEREAACIARYIRSEVDASRRSFGDFLILTRKKKSLSTYTRALEAVQVPIEVSGAGAFAESNEVAQLALLLRALSDPQDAVALVGVLRGPLFGISDPDLFAWRQAGGWFSLFPAGFDPQAVPPQHHSRVDDALSALRQYYRWTRVLPAAPALERILDHSGYLALAATAPGGVEAGDLLHAIDRVRQAVANGLTLAAAARALEQDLETASEIESRPLEPGRTDVVRLMNLHKAKGLEAPVVFLADPCGGFKPRVDVRIVREGVTARGYFKITTPYGKGTRIVAQPAGWDQYEAEEQAYLRAEETRLLYVAATRAREMLVIGRWTNTGGAGTRAWAAFEPFLGAATELPVPRRVALPAAERVDMSSNARAAAEAARQDAHARARQPSWSVTSVTAEARHIAKMARAAEPVAADDPTRVVVRDTPSHRADAGAAWGTLIHGLLEHAMRHQNATTEDLRRLAMWLTVEEPQLRAVIDEAIETVQTVASGQFWDQARSGEHTVESPFGVTQRGNVALMGVIDLLYRAGTRWQVADYKTDVGTADEDPAYAAQMASYRAALEACGLGDISATIVPARLRGTRTE